MTYFLKKVLRQQHIGSIRVNLGEPLKFVTKVVITHFWVPAQKKKKIYIYINIYSEEIGKNNNSSRMLERTENDQNN